MARKPLLWLLIPVFGIAALGSGWATIHYFPATKKVSASTTAECQSLRAFIVDREVQGKAIWQQYHSNVLQYKTGVGNQVRQVQLVTIIASQLVDVLQSDLAIYQEMFAHRACLVSSFDSQIESVISDTQMTIDFLRGQTQIQGQSFDPSAGVWNTDFYSSYETAINYLKP